MAKKKQQPFTMRFRHPDTPLRIKARRCSDGVALSLGTLTVRLSLAAADDVIDALEDVLLSMNTSMYALPPTEEMPVGHDHETIPLSLDLPAESTLACASPRHEPTKADDPN